MKSEIVMVILIVAIMIAMKTWAVVILVSIGLVFYVMKRISDKKRKKEDNSSYPKPKTWAENSKNQSN